MFNVSFTTDIIGNCKPTQQSPCYSLQKHNHSDHHGHDPKKLQIGALSHHGFLTEKRQTQVSITKFLII